MKTTRSPHGKISEHFQGLGAASLDSVIQRAREIAMINGRPPNHYLDDDFLQAKRELIGASDGAAAPETENPALANLTHWDENPEAAGHSAPKAEPADEQEASVELVEEGLDEAEHDQMVEGAKKNTR